MRKEGRWPGHPRACYGLAPARPVESGRSSQVRVALLGAGRIGKLHARLLAATEGVETLVVGDVDATSQEFGQLNLGAPELLSPDSI